MRAPKTARWLVGFAAAATLGGAVLMTPTASAQPQNTPAPTRLLPPSSGGKTDAPPRFRMYLTVLVIGAMMFGANAIPSKRGHQD